MSVQFWKKNLNPITMMKDTPLVDGKTRREYYRKQQELKKEAKEIILINTIQQMEISTLRQEQQAKEYLTKAVDMIESLVIDLIKFNRANKRGSNISPAEINSWFNVLLEPFRENPEINEKLRVLEILRELVANLTTKHIIQNNLLTLKRKDVLEVFKVIRAKINEQQQDIIIVAC